MTECITNHNKREGEGRIGKTRERTDCVTWRGERRDEDEEKGWREEIMGEEREVEWSRRG
jgi:hypothetical protein